MNIKRMSKRMIDSPTFGPCICKSRAQVGTFIGSAGLGQKDNGARNAVELEGSVRMLK